MEDDEADRAPFSGEQSVRGNSLAPAVGAAAGGAAGLGGLGSAVALDDGEDHRSEAGWRPPQQRPASGGRFPSDLNIQRGLQAPLSPSSADSSGRGRDVIAAAGALPGSGMPFANAPEKHTDFQPDAYQVSAQAPQLGTTNQYAQGHHPNIFPAHQALAPPEGVSQDGEWMAPIASGAGGAALGAGVMQHDNKEQLEERNRDRTPTAAHRLDRQTAISQSGESSSSISVAISPPISAPMEPSVLSESTTAPSSAVANTNSSGTDTRTLSTVPTSTGYTAPQRQPVRYQWYLPWSKDR